MTHDATYSEYALLNERHHSHRQPSPWRRMEPSVPSGGHTVSDEYYLCTG